MYDSFNGLNYRAADPIDSFTARTPGMDTFESNGEPQGDSMSGLIQLEGTTENSSPKRAGWNLAFDVEEHRLGALHEHQATRLVARHLTHQLGADRALDRVDGHGSPVVAGLVLEGQALQAFLRGELIRSRATSSESADSEIAAPEAAAIENLIANAALFVDQ